jgi:hypothetical protein
MVSASLFVAINRGICYNSVCSIVVFELTIL